MKPPLHGVVATFPSPEAFLAALQHAREAGYSRIEANVPFAVEGMEEFLPAKPTPVAKFVLAGGLLGATGGYFLQWYAARDYPLNVGSRPLHSWPAFIPITFELTVLTAALVGVGALLWLCGLPRLDHPLFSVTDFARASQERFFLGVLADDPAFEAREVRAFFALLKAESIEEVFA